jgi:protein-S-isoprenylcysteine O-methyltransferase Ste14
MPPYEQKEMSKKKEIKNILNIILVLFFVYLCYVIETHKHSTGNIRIGVYLCLVILVLAVFIKVNFTLKQITYLYSRSASDIIAFASESQSQLCV